MMTSRGSETLAQLISERVGRRGSGLPTFEQVSEKAVDPVTGYRAAPSVLWKVAKQGVKINPELVRAIAAGLGLPVERVQAAAAREYLGWQVSDPFGTAPGEDDEVVRVVHPAGLTSADLPRVEEILDESRRDESGG